MSMHNALNLRRWIVQAKRETRIIQYSYSTIVDYGLNSDVAGVGERFAKLGVSIIRLRDVLDNLDQVSQRTVLNEKTKGK